jgi:hypothetical protein
MHNYGDQPHGIEARPINRQKNITAATKNMHQGCASPASTVNIFIAPHCAGASVKQSAEPEPHEIQH